jgi:hypothetical protein
MRKEMLVIPVNKVTEKKRIIGKMQERHKKHNSDPFAPNEI